MFGVQDLGTKKRKIHEGGIHEKEGSKIITVLFNGYAAYLRLWSNRSDTTG